jgi:Bacterial archaeo-eukaryotic release factor family 10
MLDTKLLESLPQIPPPVLTAYIETNPADSRNLRHPPGYLIWLKSQAKDIEGELPEGERKAFREQVQRLEEHLTQYPPRARSIVIFAGPEIWHAISLHVEAEDELFWGLPSLSQMLWLMDEHRLCGVVLADRSGAQFFHYWMGEITKDHEARINIDTFEWRRKDLKPPSQPDIEVIRGTHRDAFERRVEAQYASFYSKEAEHIRIWADARKLNAIFLMGPPKLVELVWDKLPKGLQSRTLLIHEDVEHLSRAEIQARIESEVHKWEHDYEKNLVDQLFDGSDGARAIFGVDETLLRLQEGLVRSAVAVSGLEGRVRQCTKCGWTDRTVDLTCPICGGPRLLTDLRAILPPLVRRYKVPLEVIAEDVAERLSKAGGIGAVLK